MRLINKKVDLRKRGRGDEQSERQLGSTLSVRLHGPPKAAETAIFPGSERLASEETLFCTGEERSKG